MQDASEIFSLAKRSIFRSLLKAALQSKCNSNVDSVCPVQIRLQMRRKRVLTPANKRPAVTQVQKIHSLHIEEIIRFVRDNGPHSARWINHIPVVARNYMDV
jgi:hypothetical protein